MPTLESEYADDVDFLDEDPAALAQILPKATSVLKEWSLNVNEQKTEFVRVYLAGKNETDSFGVKTSERREKGLGRKQIKDKKGRGKVIREESDGTGEEADKRQKGEGGGS
ncbi:hypothetical protein ACHWQZ_G015262 [Mnemiopsis leidyi]